MALLEVEDLTIGYHTGQGTVSAVEGVSFSIEKSQSLGLVGESGCGKTTLGMAIMGLLPPNGEVLGGAIRLEGNDLLTRSPEEMRRTRWGEVAMIFQAAMNALNPVRRVEEQIAEALRTHEPGIDPGETHRRIEGLFQFVGLPKNRMSDYPHQYSGGMKQRAIIAMALACRPKLVIADEPTTALDVIVQNQILEEIQSLQDELGISLLFISHDIAVVADVCHDIGVMYAGHLVEYGARDRVFARPAHPYTRALLAAYPTLSGNQGDLQPIPGELPDLHTLGYGCRFAGRCPTAAEACRTHRPQWVAVSDHHRVLCGEGRF